MRRLKRIPSKADQDGDAPSEVAPGRALLSRWTFGSHITRRPSAASAAPSIPHAAKGPFGLTTLHQPLLKEPTAHIVFVHGLGGGSEHTWSKGNMMWPRDLLPVQDPFQSVTIHTFGYDSDFKKRSILDIHDFSKSLLGSLKDSPSVLENKSPIILVAHSMGGLVIKKAYTIARRMSGYEDLAYRIKSMFFIATPHRGSNHAQILSNILHLVSGPRLFLKDLERGSAVIITIIEEFVRFAGDIQLHSFYETKPLSITGVGKILIVEKDNAVLGYENERSEPLHGDHRSICKFDSADDPNFKILHQALAHAISDVSSSTQKLQEENTMQHRKLLSEIFNIYEPPEDDLYRVASERVPGTCSWLHGKESYRNWVVEEEPHILWLRGPPAAGKSFVSGSIIEELRGSGHKVPFFFYVYGDTSKSMISTFLLSIAWQIAVLYPEVERKVLDILTNNPTLPKASDFRTIWRKLWSQGILMAGTDSKKLPFIIVDAVDECRLDQDLVQLLLKVVESGTAKVFLTSRHDPDYYHISSRFISQLDINMEDTQRDISLYLDQYTDTVDETVRRVIMYKTNGCFLWAVLVVGRLMGCRTRQAILRTVHEDPEGMDQLYARIVQTMSNRDVAEHILTWVACAIRPLTLEEMEYAVSLHTEEDRESIRAIITRNCYDLVYINAKGQIRMRHSSAREFLLRNDINNEQPGFTIDSKQGHKMLTLACLRYLTGPEMKGKQKRKMSVNTKPRSAFVSYASIALYGHLNSTSAQDEEVLHALATFLRSTNLLAWIEYLSQQKRLEVILDTAQSLRSFIRRKSKRDLLLGEDVVVVNDWVIDLVKLATKFGRQLLQHPESIFRYIPAFCPSNTMPYKQFATGPNILSVCGISATTWDDCLTSVTIRNKMTATGHVNENSSGTVQSSKNVPQPRVPRVSALAASDKAFALGTSDGRVVIFNEKTCLEERMIESSATIPIQILQFASVKSYLACVNNRSIQLWNTETWECLLTVPVGKRCLGITFIDNDQLLLAALKDNKLLTINLVDMNVKDQTGWAVGLAEEYGRKLLGKDPLSVAFHPEMDLLAVVYRGSDIIIWNYEEEDIYRIYNFDRGLVQALGEPFAAVMGMAFSRLPQSSLLAASYNVADLVLFDTLDGKIKARVSNVGALSLLTSSPDGRTLAGAGHDGTIALFDFETLRWLYRIRMVEPGITGLTFSADNTRLLDTRGRGRSCRVWDPPALYRREIPKESTRTPSSYSGDSDYAETNTTQDAALVTAVVCDETGDFFFVGKDDNTVSVYSASNGVLIKQLLTHGTSILKLVYTPANRTLTSVDTAGCLMASRIDRVGLQWDVNTIFTHQTTGTGIQHFLCNSDSTRILVCANDQANVHSVLNPSTVSRPVNCGDLGPYCWAQHPSRPELLLLISRDTAFLYSWRDLIKTGLEDGILLTTSLLPELTIQSALSILDGSILALSYSGAATFAAKPYLFCYESESFGEDSTSVSHLESLQTLCEKIEHIIGTFHKRLVFLNVNGWICSVKIQGFGAPDSISHHFMPPSDWMKTSRDFLIRVSELGDLLFAWKGEVAVVKRGLERSFDLLDD
ncbi:hypothetical protein JX265_003059 [Neoarthrinium moseri]|uniref:GPI inositol-deacylase n=1 Tax=Neoarthrinium moseri TaxID=1658444 RepID=A0A9P9WT57_9PEZI|nr:hypothetical protein JX266_002118 [Neoarthrinium moseri]KAI1878882.1 hypothetical protein JX265_003059 [Neoarthrinium moseri]